MDSLPTRGHLEYKHQVGSNDIYRLREWYGAFPDSGPLAEDSAAELKRIQLNVCIVCVYCVRRTFFPPAAETCARLAGNFCGYLTTVMSGANGMVWLNV